MLPLMAADKTHRKNTMIRQFTHNITDYIVTVHDSETERTLHVRNATDKQSRLSLTMSHENIVDSTASGENYGVEMLGDLLVADFKRLVDEKLLAS
jgi:hypothetical protein